MKIVHTADWHWSEQRMERCLKSANFILEYLNLIQPDLHVIAGDYWDKRQVLSDASAVIPALDTMKRLASISPVIIISGNNAHDASGSLSIFQDLDTKFPVFTAERPETLLFHPSKSKGAPRFEVYNSSDPLSTVAKNTSAVIHLFPYPNKSYFLSGKEDLSIDESNLLIAETLRGLFLGFAAIAEGFAGPKIFVGHCNVDGATLSTGQSLLGQDIMISRHDLEIVGADYYALGHIHRHQKIDPKIWYSGSIYHINFGESEPKSLNLVEMGRKRMKVTAVRIPSTPLALHEARFDSTMNTIIDDNTSEDWKEAELRVRLYLTEEQSSLVTDDEIRNRYPGASTYKIERIILPEERIRSEEIVRARTLREKVHEWATQLGKDIPDEVFQLADQMESLMSHNA